MVMSDTVDSWGRSCVFKLEKITVREVCGKELTSLQKNYCSYECPGVLSDGSI